MRKQEILDRLVKTWNRYEEEELYRMYRALKNDNMRMANAHLEAFVAANCAAKKLRKSIHKIKNKQ